MTKYKVSTTGQFINFGEEIQLTCTAPNYKLDVKTTFTPDLVEYLVKIGAVKIVKDNTMPTSPEIKKLFRHLAIQNDLSIQDFNVMINSMWKCNKTATLFFIYKLAPYVTNLSSILKPLIKEVEDDE